MSRRQRCDEPIDVELYVARLVATVGSYPEEARTAVIRKMTEERGVCPCCLLRWIAEREITRAQGGEVEPLVNFGERVEVDRAH